MTMTKNTMYLVTIVEDMGGNRSLSFSLGEMCLIRRRNEKDKSTAIAFKVRQWMSVFGYVLFRKPKKEWRFGTLCLDSRIMIFAIKLSIQDQDS